MIEMVEHVRIATNDELIYYYTKTVEKGTVIYENIKTRFI